MKRNLFVLAVLLLSMACKEKKATEGPTQMEQVMAIHDEVMPKMGKLGTLMGKLKTEKDPKHQPYKTALEDLQAANTAMMAWMENFGNRFSAEEILQSKALSAQKQVWLQEEKEKVKALRAQIYASIQKAEALLSQE